MDSFIFVYGTLMQNQDNKHALAIRNNAKYIGNGFVYAKKYNLGEYPAILLDHTQRHRTYGDVFRIEKNEVDLLVLLDDYEGFISINNPNNLFVRKKTEAIVGVKKYRTWIYEYANSIDRL